MVSSEPFRSHLLYCVGHMTRLLNFTLLASIPTPLTYFQVLERVSNSGYFPSLPDFAFNLLVLKYTVGFMIGITAIQYIILAYVIRLFLGRRDSSKLVHTPSHKTTSYRRTPVLGEP
jgi:hypothetical protein